MLKANKRKVSNEGKLIFSTFWLFDQENIMSQADLLQIWEIGKLG